MINVVLPEMYKNVPKEKLEEFAVSYVKKNFPEWKAFELDIKGHVMKCDVPFLENDKNININTNTVEKEERFENMNIEDMF